MDKIHYSTSHQTINFMNTHLHHPCPSSSCLTRLSCSPGHDHVPPAPTEGLITLKGLPPPHISLLPLSNAAHYWNYQVRSNNLPAYESRWAWGTTVWVSETFYWKNKKNTISLQKHGSNLCQEFYIMEVDKLNIYNLSAETQSVH